MCRNGHAVNSPADEHGNGTRNGVPFRKCAACCLRRSRSPEYNRMRRAASDTYMASTKGILTQARRELRYAHQRLETL